MNEETKASRELDAIIAERVMNFPLPAGGANMSYPYYYSTDLHAAWMIVEKLRERFPVIKMATGDVVGDQWQVAFHDRYYESVVPDGHGGFANAETLPLAISLAALATVKEKE